MTKETIEVLEMIAGIIAGAGVFLLVTYLFIRLVLTPGRAKAEDNKRIYRDESIRAKDLDKAGKCPRAESYNQFKN